MVKDISRRAFMKVGAALSIAFSAILAACSGNAVDTFELDELYTFELDELEFLNGLTREELNERLSALAEIPDETPTVPGATCYIGTIGEPEYTPLPCNTCSENAQMTEWQINSLEDIQATVNEIIKEGFDVKLDVIIACKKCAAEDNARYQTIFGIRFIDDADYHMVETINVFNYKILLAFLQEKTAYTDSYNDSYQLCYYLNVIEEMTGLKHE